MSRRHSIYRFGYLIVVGLMSQPWGVQAQQTLTLETAIQEARTNNPDLKVVRQKIGVAAGELKTASLLFPFNPQVEFERTSDRYYAKQGEGGYDLSVSQEVEIAGQRWRRRRVAQADLERAQAEVQDFERRLTADVREAFYRLLFSQRRAETMKAIADLNGQLAEAAQKRFKAGDISELDYNLVLIERSRSGADLALSEAQAYGAMGEMNRLLGRPPDVVTVAADASFRETMETGTTASSPIEPAREPVKVPDLEALKAAALRVRPDLKALEAGVQAARGAVSVVLAGLTPNPVFSLTYRVEKSFFAGEDISGDPAVTRGIAGIRDRDRLLTARVSLPLPLFNRSQGQTYAARAAQRVAETELESLRRAVAIEVTVAYRRLQSALRARALFQEVAPKLDENAALVVRAYRAGETDLATLLVEQDRIFRAKLVYLDALMEYESALVALERAVGEPIPKL